MRIFLEGYTKTAPSSPSVAMEIANNWLRLEARGYTPTTLERASKIHRVKLSQWIDGNRELLIDDLSKIAKVLDLKFKYYE